jgi:hypothetical protein
MKHPRRNEQLALRPVGLALAAVVAGLGAGQAAAEAPQRAPLEPSTQSHSPAIDPTNAAGFGEDSEMIVGPSTPVAPFGD